MDAVKLPSHRHPLNRRELLPGGESRVCGLCGKDVTNGSAYECSRCNFTAHLDCAENPPKSLLVVDNIKVHKHPLTLLPRHYVSFICDACGLCRDKSPYVCLQCAFMIHQDCMDFPRVIKISRHLHRLAHTFFPGPGDWRCGICHQKVDGNYGAYTCISGDKYVVHLKCATRVDVWDGKELEGEPEEVYNRMLFIEIGDGAIRHFSHEHFLRLLQSNKDMIRVRSGVCSACSFPLDTNRFYTCQQCEYFLHEVCAYLPRKKISFLHVHPLTLCTEDETTERSGGGGSNGLSRCGACDLYFNGFSYRCLLPGEDHVKFDVKCSSVSEPFDYHLHPHPLYVVSGTSTCTLCEQQHPLRYSLRCYECDFTVCFVCATAPREVNYKYDDEHLLYSNISKYLAIDDPYCCDICENKIHETGRIHYKCAECGPVVLHNECALGSFRNMRPGFSFVTHEGRRNKYEVIINDRVSLLRCIQCQKDCHEPLLLMTTTTTTNNNNVTIYLCSATCFDTYVSDSV